MSHEWLEMFKERDRLNRDDEVLKIADWLETEFSDYEHLAAALRKFQHREGNHGSDV